MTAWNHDKRSLNRNIVKYGIDLTAVIRIDGIASEIEVLDMNSTAVRLNLKSLNLKISENSSISLELFYGKESICQIESPNIIRHDPKEIVFDIRNSRSRNSGSRPNRVRLSTNLQGVLTGVDPFSVDQMLFFKVRDISSRGMRIATSKSNSHLTTGLTLKDFDLQIPGFRKRKISLRIKHVEVSDSDLLLGCEITESSKTVKQDLSILKLMLTDLSSDETSDHEIKSAVKNIRHFKGLIKVRYSRSLEEYRKVLDLRFRSYQAANKTQDSQTLEDMSDEFDQRSVILIASIGSNIVGTLRIVFHENGLPLPCEKYLNLGDIKAIDRSQCAEISRFAIDPRFQGSDIFIAISKQLVVELTMKKVKYPICLATTKLAPSYLALGGTKVSGDFAHPTIANETLALYWLRPENVYSGKTGALSWFWIVRPAIKKLNRIGLLQRVPLALTQYTKFLVEFVGLLAQRKLNRQKFKRKR